MLSDSVLKGFTAVYQGLPYILTGVWVTVIVVAGALLVGFIIGVPMAIGHVYGNRTIKRMIDIYVWFFRGIPLLVLLLLIYFGVLVALNISLSSFVVSIFILGMISSAYQSQIVKGSINSISRGQLMAARAIGMSDRQAITSIIVPQALRLSLPGWSNEYAIQLKESAVTYALGVSEIMTRAHHVASRTYQHLAIFILAGFIFLALTWIGTGLIRRLETHVRIPGYTQ